MNKIYTLLFFVCFSSFTFGQEIITKKFRTSNEINENSGLLYFNGKIITHNDSGGKANLYELDTLSGSIIRIVAITNATNVDWEDIAQDEKHIYIGDIGNNYASRTNLKIYKILKNDYLNTERVVAEIINFSYSDQTSFTSSKINNFDAEALIVYNNKLVIFSKNRKDNQSKIYTLSKEAGTHVAEHINTINVDGLITGATINPNDDSIVLCGYGEGLSPFLIYLDDTNSDFFAKVDLTSLMGLGNQIEGITFVNNHNYFLSREELKKSMGGFTINIPPTMFSFNKNKIPYKIVDSFIKENLTNTDDKLSTNYQFESINITDELGTQVLQKMDSFNYVKKLSSGKYILKVKIDDRITIINKISID